MLEKGSKIGVIFVLHGGMDTYKHQFLWDASVQMFSYDQNHPVYSMVIWNSAAWSTVLETEFAIKFIRKYKFEYDRIGGIDPFHRISDRQFKCMQAVLDNNDQGLIFETDYACWMASDRIEHYPYPRFIYNGPPGSSDKCTYCGEDEATGPWSGCDPERYNVDGPVERLLKKGASRIIMIDLTVGGPRFYKTFDVVEMTRRALNDWNEKHQTAVALVWVNDFSNLMQRAYPIEPEGWTPILGPPDKLQPAIANGSPNPVSSDPDLALLHVEGIESGMSPMVSAAETGIVLFNHGFFTAERRFFDPKIDDTLILNKNIKSILIRRHPDMVPANIVGAYGGVKELNPENGLVERTRNMRGEDLAHANQLGSEQDMPGDEWGYRYWNALEYLKNRGVKHIVIGFPQVVADSVLTMVELYNQVAKEIGVKTWLKHKEGNFPKYPESGHPFAEYWGNWIDFEYEDEDNKRCCLTMGGCKDGGIYPPLRRTPLDSKREDMDPSLAFDLCDYGHLGYDSARGAPDPQKPVQDQYAGTWEIYTPPNCDARLGQIPAKHVLNALLNPMVSLSNGNLKAAPLGQTVIWTAHVAGGNPEYNFEWAINKEATEKWIAVGDGSSSWKWTPGADDTGSYDIRCRVTDAANKSGEAVWDKFFIKPLLKMSS